MCPDDNTLSAWVENNLTGLESKKIESHLNSCPECFEKVFFLKKALMREFLFLKGEKESGLIQKAVLLIENQNIKIKNILGGIHLKPLELAFRNQNFKKSAVLIELGTLRIRVEKNGEEILLSLEQEGQLQIQTAQGRFVFSGKLAAGLPVYLKAGQDYHLKAENEEISLELKNV